MTHLPLPTPNAGSDETATIDPPLPVLEPVERIFNSEAPASRRQSRFALHRWPPFQALIQKGAMLQPLWLLSIGLHSLLLVTPLPSEAPPQPKPKVHQSIKVTKIAALKPTRLARPKPPRQVVKPLLRPVPRLPQPVLAIPHPRPAVAVPAPQPKPLAKLQPEAQSTPQPTPFPSSLPTTDTEGEGLTDFPQYPGAQPGCFNLSSCFQTADGLEKVSDFFTQTLGKQKWTVQPSISEGGRRVYRVSKGRVSQFLSILTADKVGTVYVLADQARVLGDLSQAVEVPPEIGDIFNSISATETDSSATSQPNLFSSKSSNIITMMLLTDATPDTVFDSYFRTNLSSQGFEISEGAQLYGGGPVYSIKREKFTGYLNLVPSNDGKGTVMILWKVPPA